MLNVFYDSYPVYVYKCYAFKKSVTLILISLLLIFEIFIDQHLS